MNSPFNIFLKKAHTITLSRFAAKAQSVFGMSYEANNSIRFLCHVLQDDAPGEPLSRLMRMYSAGNQKEQPWIVCCGMEWYIYGIHALEISNDVSRVLITLNDEFIKLSHWGKLLKSSFLELEFVLLSFFLVTKDWTYISWFYAFCWWLDILSQDANASILYCV